MTVGTPIRALGQYFHLSPSRRKVHLAVSFGNLAVAERYTDKGQLLSALQVLLSCSCTTRPETTWLSFLRLHLYNDGHVTKQSRTFSAVSPYHDLNLPLILEEAD